MTIEKLKEILKSHELWLEDEPNGRRADLSGANLSRANLSEADLRYADLRYVDLSGANLSGANLSRADLRYANLSRADLSRANLSEADLRGANLSGANLSEADLSRVDLSGANLSGANLSEADLRYADLRYVDLSGADLRYADLSGANLSGANLSRADLSGADGILSTVNFLESHFERTKDGYIAYKTFNSMYNAPDAWKIEKGSVIEENVNFDRCNECGCGINIAPLEWVRHNYSDEIWKVLIRWEWLCGVCIPYRSDGKIRCERVELLEVMKND